MRFNIHILVSVIDGLLIELNRFVNYYFKILSLDASCTESDEQIVKYEDANMDTNANDTVLANEYSSLEVCNEITLDRSASS